MAKDYCEACESLKTKDPSMIVNGFGDEECANLQADLGIDGESTDCEDLDMMNECLIGSMEAEAEIADSCNWRQWGKDLVNNVWTMNKAFICTMCGIWTNIHDLWTNVKELWKKVNKLLCIVDHMGSGVEFEIGEEETDGSFVVAGKGVSFLKTDGSTGAHTSDVRLTYVGGGLVSVVAGLNWYTDDFVDEDYCYCFDEGGSQIMSKKNRLGNSQWNNTSGTTKPMPSGGELVFEIRIKKSKYPELSELFAGTAFPSGGGSYLINLTYFDEGEKAYGQSGSADTKHTVPQGWIYVQARMVSIDYLHANGSKYSPRGYMGIRFNVDEIEC